MALCISATRLAPEDTAGAATYSYRIDREEVLIGRSDAVDVRLPDPAVSLVHGRLLSSDGQLVYIDLKSTNGSLVDGRPTIAHERVPVGVGSRMVIGPFELRIVPATPDGASTTPRDTASFARQMVLEALQALGSQSETVIEVLSGPLAGHRRDLSLGETIVLGRGEECELQLEDRDVSRRHAEIRCEPDGVRFVDLNSKNGILLNDARVDGSARLHDGDEMQLGLTRLHLHDPADGALVRLQEPPDDGGGPGGDADEADRSQLDSVRSGEVRLDRDSEQSLSAASAFEMGSPDSVLAEAQFEEGPLAPSRKMDVLLLAVGAALVIFGAALIAYLLTY